MTINRNMKTAEIYETTNVYGEYGEREPPVKKTDCKISILPLSKSLTNNGQYIDIDYVGFTEYSIDVNQYVKSDNKMYKITMVNKYNKYYQCYLKEVH